MSADNRPLLVQISATKLARTESQHDQFSDQAQSLADQLRAQGWEVMVENVDRYEGPIAVGAPAEPDAPPEGWGFPGRSNKAHYFVDATSLCRKWGFFHGELELGRDDHSQNCAECKRLVAKRKAAAG